MTRFLQYILLLLIFFASVNQLVYSANEIPADNPYIQYYGR